MQYGRLTISPPLAKEILEKSQIRNRPISQTVIDRYAKTMKLGLWDTENSATLAFDTKGNLIDGQHRLYALIQAGITLTFACFRDCSPDAFKTIDVGRIRSPGDLLYLNGNINNNIRNTAAILCKLYAIHNYNSPTMYDRASTMIKEDPVGVDKLNRFLAPLSSCNIEAVCNRCNVFYKQSGRLISVTASGVIILAYMRQASISNTDKDRDYITKLEEFLKQICEKTNLEKGSQALAYINTILKIKMKDANDHNRSSLCKYIAMVNAWNNHLQKRKAKTVAYTAEKYLPKLTGYEYDYIEE